MSPRAPVLALAPALAACDEHRSVTLLLGPDDHTLTVGFTCKDDSGNLLLQHARAGGMFTFQLVFETLDLGGDLPGCRGEELLETCVAGSCQRIQRSCTMLSIPVSSSETDILASLHDKLGHQTLLDDAPSDPIVVRAVTTLQSCDELVPPSGDFPALDPDLALGCAYSCPVVLGELTGSLGLALDTLDNQCAPEVRACAKLGGL